jgi:hypothetical protein
VGILERLTRSPSPRERFVEEVLAELRRIGVRQADYRPRQFAIVCDAGQDMFSWLFLARAFIEYERKPGDRKQFVRDFVANSLAPAEAPERFELARPRLAVALRHETHGLGTDSALIRRHALPCLDEVLLVDHPRAYLDDTYPARWGVSEEELFAAARSSMWSSADELEGASALGRSVIHVPDYGGGTVISRLLLDGWLADFADRIGGRPVAFAPSNLMLLICVDEPPIVAQLYQLALEEFGRSARPLSPMAYTPDASGRISVYSPPVGHPAYGSAAQASCRLRVTVASRQREALRDSRLAALETAVRRDGTAFTSATWDLGLETLLPQADFVGLAEPGERARYVPWAVLFETDELVEELEYRPARFRTPARPSAAALGYLLERAVSP